VLPHQRLALDFNPSSCPREQVVDSDQLAELVPRLRRLVEQGSGSTLLESEAVPAVVQLFEQQLLPDQAADAAEHEQRAAQLAVQQVDVLDLLSRQPSFTVIGGAGTGKTGLALEQARRLTAAGRRVALVCYSRGLARYLQLQAQAWKDRPAFVGTFHQLALDWGVEPGTGSDYFEEAVPRGLQAAAAGRTDLFDAVVVDEAQDFGALWWPAMTACCGRRRGSSPSSTKAAARLRAAGRSAGADAAVPAAPQLSQYQAHRPDLRLPGIRAGQVRRAYRGPACATSSARRTGDVPGGRRR
jgi:hypothetical protein